jgi:hypothetical protein
MSRHRKPLAPHMHRDAPRLEGRTRRGEETEAMEGGGYLRESAYPVQRVVALNVVVPALWRRPALTGLDAVEDGIRVSGEVAADVLSAR